MSSGISFTCDSCGREVFSCNIVNGMKFCAKCYQETFGNQQNKESSELLVNSLAEKDKQIAELQNQLKSQPAEIVEKIRKQIFNHFNVNNMEEYESLSLLDSLFTADAVTDMLDNILKEYQKNKEEK